MLKYWRDARVLKKPLLVRKTERFVFTSDRGAPFTTAGFARKVERLEVPA